MFRPSSQADVNQRDGSNYFGSPPTVGTLDPYTAGYHSPAPVPGTHYGPPGSQHQKMLHGPPLPQQQGMLYAPHL
ncbi:hypothetical protein GJ744_002081 [Endocarpon pusillum]|uniref:Uncharacterized protein n=1 Tax=Endocarpon pusillum TaxID=364733 RepID=A0A8H7ACG6_9EURO|nr:hypothetical protein GJ744_002081 [Endocarpon pusillum]